MPRIEKDCHAFTIKAEREKHREMMNNLNASQNKAVVQNNHMLNQKNPNPFYQKQTEIPKVKVNSMTAGTHNKQMQQQVNNVMKSQVHESIIRSLQENLGITKARTIHRENSNQIPQTAKSDSTLDTDVALETRNEEKNPPHLSLQSVVTQDLNCNPPLRGKGRVSQQDLKEFEKMSKKQFVENNIRGKEISAVLQGNGTGMNGIAQ